MITRQNRWGLGLAFVLGLLDIAILLALTGDDSVEKPPVGIVVTSVIFGIATIVAVALAWRKPTRPMVLTVIALRVVSALGGIAGIMQGDAAAIIISSIAFVLTAISVALLRNWFSSGATASLS